MRKIITTTCVVVLLCAGTAYTQQWTFSGVFPLPDGIPGGSGAHGLAVDPDGKIWYQSYGAMDSIMTAAGTKKATRSLRVWNPDGTPSALDRLKVVTVNGVPDTLWNSGRGLARDNNGNILACHYDEIYRINYMTGEGMNYCKPVLDMSLTAASADNNGNVVVGPVVPGNPAVLLDPDLVFLGNVIDATVGYARTIVISPDGNTVYWVPYTAKNQLWTRPDEFSPFSVATTDSNWMAGMQPECNTYHPVTGQLWLSAGSFAGPPAAGSGFTPNTWYGIDVATQTVHDSVKWQFNTPGSPDEKPRAIAFSPDGNICYIGCFGLSTYPAIQKFEKVTGVGWVHTGVIDGYTLSQNYPNPFNPRTTIQFSIGQDGVTTLKVYDMLGREVATLVNEFMTSGTYTADFDASQLPSGTYLYELKSQDHRLVKKMSVVK